MAALVLLCAGWSDPGAGYYRHGQQALAKQDYDQAYVDFRKAAELSPKNVDYQLAMEHAQFSAANSHIQKGEQFKAQKQYPEAIAEMQKAATIDPGNFVAGQEIQNLTDLMHPPAPRPGEPVSAAGEDDIAERLDRAEGPVELGDVANTVLKDFSFNGDPKAAYTSLGALAHLNVIFDASSTGAYTNSGRVTLDLHNVSLLEVLRIIGVQSSSFYTVITPNTILVANDNPQKHQAVDPTVLKVFYLKNSGTTANDATELVTAIRGLMQPQPHLMVIPSINALVMRDSPDKVALVQKLLDDLDKAPPEVVVDVKVLQINQDKARDLGLLPPNSFSIGLQAPQTSTTSTTSTTTTTGTTGTTTNSPTLNELTHLNSTNFSVTIPNATLNAILSDTNTRTIQEPQLRSVQGVKAELIIGEKIPVATGSFQPGIGGVGINPLVNTQFTYQNVGVTIDVTPQIHGDNEVLLKNHIEISALDGTSSLGGISQPIFGTKTIDHTVELKDGDSAVLGGMLEDDLEHNVSGVAILDQIPLLGGLFSSTHDETTHNEILVVMTPHIVHNLDITRLDRLAIDTGTQDDVTLHELPPAAEATVTGAPAGAAATVTPAGGAAPRLATPNLPAAGPAGTGANPGANAAPRAATGTTPSTGSLVVEPTQINGVVGSPFGVQVNANGLQNAYSLTFSLNYDSRMMELQSIKEGGFLGQDGQAVSMVHREDTTGPTANAQITISRPPNVGGVSGSGSLITLTFVAKAPGTAPITISRLSGRDPQMGMVTLQSAPATVTIH